MESLSDSLNPIDTQLGGGRPAWDGNWRLTECIGCPAAPLHIAMGCLAGGLGLFPAATKALFYEGILHEQDMKQRIRDNGETIVEFPDGLAALDIPVISHPDGYLHERGIILETKSSGDADDPDAFLASHQNYVRQVMGYERIAGVDGGVLLVKNRDTGWILPDILVNHDSKVTDPIWDNINVIVKILQSGTSSCKGPWYPDCSRDFMTRLYCPFNGTHCKTTEAQAVGALNSILDDYGPRKAFLDVLDSQVQQLRTAIEIMMKDASLRRVVSDGGVSALISNRKYPTADKEKARKLLPPDIFDEIFGESSSEQLRITVPKEMRKGIVVP